MIWIGWIAAGMLQEPAGGQAAEMRITLESTPEGIRQATVETPDGAPPRGPLIPLPASRPAGPRTVIGARSDGDSCQAVFYRGGAVPKPARLRPSATFEVTILDPSSVQLVAPAPQLFAQGDCDVEVTGTWPILTARVKRCSAQGLFFLILGPESTGTVHITQTVTGNVVVATCSHGAAVPRDEAPAAASSPDTEMAAFSVTALYATGIARNPRFEDINGAAAEASLSLFDLWGVSLCLSAEYLYFPRVVTDPFTVPGQWTSDLGAWLVGFRGVYRQGDLLSTAAVRGGDLVGDVSHRTIEINGEIGFGVRTPLGWIMVFGEIIWGDERAGEHDLRLGALTLFKVGISQWF